MDEALLFGDASMEPLEDDGADLGGGMALVGSASVVEVGGSGSGSGAGTASTLSSSQASVVQSQPADPMRQTFVDALSTLKSIAQASKGGVASCVGSCFLNSVCLFCQLLCTATLPRQWHRIKAMRVHCLRWESRCRTFCSTLLSAKCRYSTVLCSATACLPD